MYDSVTYDVLEGQYGSMMTGMMQAYWIVAAIISIVTIVAMWKVFEKAGEAGWKALIPIVNTYTLFKIAYGNGWRFLLLLIPFANIVFSILLYVELSRSFGEGGAFAAGLIFLNTIFVCILGFGSMQYVGSKKERENAYA